MLKPWFELEEIKRNGNKGVVPPGQDPNQLILQSVKRKGLRKYMFLQVNKKFLC